MAMDMKSSSDEPELPAVANHDRFAELSRIVGGLAHEIKNPLSTINLNLKLLGEDLARYDDEDHRRLVRRLITGRLYQEGMNVMVWDGTDDGGRSLPSGLYLARIRAGGFSEITKLTLMR